MFWECICFSGKISISCNFVSILCNNHKDWQFWHNPSPWLQPPPPSLPPPTHPEQTYSSKAQAAARCHILDPQWQHRVTEAEYRLCVPSNTHVTVKDCQIVSYSSQPSLKYFMVWPSTLCLPSTHKQTHTHIYNRSSSVSQTFWPYWMWISAEALTTESLACQHVEWQWSDALNQKCVWY